MRFIASLSLSGAFTTTRHCCTLIWEETDNRIVARRASARLGNGPFALLLGQLHIGVFLEPKAHGFPLVHCPLRISLRHARMDRSPEHSTEVGRGRDISQAHLFH